MSPALHQMPRAMDPNGTCSRCERKFGRTLSKSGF